MDEKQRNRVPREARRAGEAAMATTPSREGLEDLEVPGDGPRAAPGGTPGIAGVPRNESEAGREGEER